MNNFSGTGWLVKDSWTATTPGTHRRLLLFDLMIANDDGEPAPWRCEIEREALINRVESKLVAGAGIILCAELRARPFVRHNVREGFSRYLLVHHVEFSRLPVAADQPQPEPAPVA